MPYNSINKPRFRPLRSVEQSILSCFRIGDWRIGLKEMMDKTIVPPCAMCNSISLSLPHFLLWCPVLDSVRRASGLYAYIVENLFFKQLSEEEVIKLYLDAKGNEKTSVKERGHALASMRNEWYRVAMRKGINLNVRTKEIRLID